MKKIITLNYARNGFISASELENILNYIVKNILDYSEESEKQLQNKIKQLEDRITALENKKNKRYNNGFSV